MEERARVIGEITDLVRRLGAVSDELGQVFAATHGLHATDFRALGLVYQHEREGTPLTAKALAEHLGLTQSAATYVVDRLVGSGHVERQRDPRDGRRVLLRQAPSGRELARAFFGPLGRAHADAMSRYSASDLELIRRFLGDVIETLADAEGEPGKPNSFSL